MCTNSVKDPNLAYYTGSTTLQWRVSTLNCHKWNFALNHPQLDFFQKSTPSFYSSFQGFPKSRRSNMKESFWLLVGTPIKIPMLPTGLHWKTPQITRLVLESKLFICSIFQQRRCDFKGLGWLSMSTILLNIFHTFDHLVHYLSLDILETHFECLKSFNKDQK